MPTSGRPPKQEKRSPESMREADPLAKADTHEAGKKPKQKRTAGNHPADPNRLGADWNLLPPGISDDDVRNPGGMQEDADKPRRHK